MSVEKDSGLTVNVSFKIDSVCYLRVVITKLALPP